MASIGSLKFFPKNVIILVVGRLQPHPRISYPSEFNSIRVCNLSIRLVATLTFQSFINATLLKRNLLHTRRKNNIEDIPRVSVVLEPFWSEVRFVLRAVWPTY